MLSIIFYPLMLNSQENNSARDSLLFEESRPSFSLPVINSSFILNGDQIKTLPFRGIQNYLLLNTDYIIQDGKAHLRGSRADEIGYFLEGIDIRNPMNGAMYDLLIEEGLEKMEVRTGAFGLDYGNAAAGIVTQRMRSGGEKFTIGMNYRGEPVEAGTDMGGSYANGYQNGVLWLSGPALDGKLKYFLAQEIHYEKDHTPRFYSPFAYEDLPGVSYTTGYRDTIVDIIWDGKLAPNNSLERYKTNASLSYAYKNLNIRVIGAYKYQKKYDNKIPVFSLMNSRSGYLRGENFLLGARGSWRFDEKLKISGGLSYTSYYSETIDDWAGDDYRLWGADETMYEHNVQPFPYWVYGYWEIMEFRFIADGSIPRSYYVKDKYTSADFSLNAEYKLSGADLIITGFNFHSLGLNHYAIKIVSEYEDDFESPAEFALKYDVNNYGYDVYGNDYSSDYDKPYSPYNGSFYLNYYRKTKNVRIAAGLRYEFFNTDSYALTSEFFNNIGIPEKEKTERAATQYRLSPNLSVAMTLSQTASLLFNFSKNYQMTAGTYRYRGNYRFRDLLNQGGYSLNLGFDEEPVEYTHFETGLKTRFDKYLTADLIFYYNEIENQSALSPINKDNQEPYTVNKAVINKDYGYSKGFNLRISLRKNNEIFGTLSYSYNDSKGISSDPLDYLFHYYFEDLQTSPHKMYPFDFSVKHRFNFLFGYRFQPRAGKILNNLSAVFNLRYSSGHPYTKLDMRMTPGYFIDTAVDNESKYFPGTAENYINSDVTPSVSTIDFHLEKQFDIGENLGIRLYADILNLLNTKNALNVFRVSGSSDSDNFIQGIMSLPVDHYAREYLERLMAKYKDFENFYTDINLNNSQSYSRRIGKEMYGTPRLFRLGIELVY
jgi:hypothetical protein